MAYKAISGTVPQYSTENNELASGYWLKFYDANTTTPRSMATDDTGGTLLAKCKLNTRGMPISNANDDNTVFIPHMNADYRIVLYKTEADADANNTADAEFNIPDTAPEIAPSADAADITLRTNKLEAWDDYDRSPLFVDGTDFTAGAGPHTITVPSGWDPTDAAMRFWRLDAPADTVTALTPTSKSTTSFTLAETLLSTDVIFIGDDQFRNQMDGDPADIRTRLSVYSKAEVYTKTEVDTKDATKLTTANNLQEIEDAGAAAQADARTNIGLTKNQNTVTLGGGFSAGEQIKCVKISDQVVISGVGILSHTSGSSAASSAGIIPATYRPSASTTNIYYRAGNLHAMVIISSTGEFTLQYFDNSGASISVTDSQRMPSISYNV